MDRRALALEYVDLSGVGLEIGPSYNPLVPKASGAAVLVVDHANREQLVAKYGSWGLAPHLLDAIEDVDYVWTGGSLLDVVPDRGTYDFIVASHLVEHTVDLVGFLRDCAALLSDDGRVALVIPDKRFCFDRFQPLSTLGGVMDAHLGRSRFHSPGTLLDHQAYAVKRGSTIAWGPGESSPFALQFPNLEGAKEAIDVGVGQSEYRDVHHWRFVPASFRLLVHDLRELGYADLVVVGYRDTVGFEFYVTLGKGLSNPSVDRLAMLLEIERALSPGFDPLHNHAGLSKPRSRWLRFLRRP